MLFPNVVRDITVATRGMSHYEFLTRCSRPDCAVVRDLLEDWFSRYPQQESKQLQARLISDETNFCSAFWELYLHQLLSSLGYSVEIHPDPPAGESTQPDFLAKSSAGEEVIVEAVAAVKKSEDDPATTRRKQAVLDKLDELEHPDFYVGLREDGYPTTSPSGRKIRDSLKKWLDSLNHDTCSSLVSQERFDELPTCQYVVEGWTLDFQAIPKPGKRRGQQPGRLILFHEVGIHMVDARTPIRDAIRRKASRYGDIQRPYIVAVNAIGHFIDDIDIVGALFGQEIILYSVSRELQISHRPARRPDGVWTSEEGARNTRISGVLLGLNVFPSSVAVSELALYHNPWAQRTYKGLLSCLDEYLPEDARLEKKEGVHPRTIFQLKEGWPNSTPS
jgi:hypothetical protein